MRATLRPILGFSWRGWVLLAVAGALLYCYLGGFDLRHAIQQAIADHFGLNRMFLFTTNVLPPWSLGLRGPTPGPACLIYVLPAMFLAPIRWRWWHWALAVAFLTAAHWYGWKLIVLSNRMPRGAFPWTQGACDLAMSLLFTALILAGTRSWRLALRAAAVSILAALAVVWLTRDSQRPAPSTPPDAFLLVAGAWHAAIGGSLLDWAIRTRRAFRPNPDECPACGYDLSSLPACPECGRPRAP